MAVNESGIVYVCMQNRPVEYMICTCLSCWQAYTMTRRGKSQRTLDLRENLRRALCFLPLNFRSDVFRNRMAGNFLNFLAYDTQSNQIRTVRVIFNDKLKRSLAIR